MALGYMRQEVIPLFYGGDYSPGRSLTDVVAQFHCDIGWAAYEADQQELAASFPPSTVRAVMELAQRFHYAEQQGISERMEAWSVTMS